MEILVVILIIALIAAVAFIVIGQRRPGGAGGLRRSRSPITRGRSVPRNDPMAAAVVEHAQVTDPADVPAAEQRLKAQARQVAAPLQAEANRAEHQRAADQLADGGELHRNGYVDPAPAYEDPASDPRYADPAPVDPADPRYDDRRRRI
jgi:hypothetical protein